jgi:hypothetical protein
LFSTNGKKDGEQTSRVKDNEQLGEETKKNREGIVEYVEG